MKIVLATMLLTIFVGGTFALAMLVDLIWSAGDPNHSLPMWPTLRVCAAAVGGWIVYMIAKDRRWI